MLAPIRVAARRVLLLVLALVALPAAAANAPPTEEMVWATSDVPRDQLYIDLVSVQTGEILVRGATLAEIAGYVTIEEIEINYDPFSDEELVLVPSEALRELMISDLVTLRGRLEVV